MRDNINKWLINCAILDNLGGLMQYLASNEHTKNYIQNNFADNNIWKDLLTQPNTKWFAEKDCLIAWVLDERTEIYHAYNYDLKRGEMLTGIRFYIDDKYPNFKVCGFYDLRHLINNPSKFLEVYQTKLDMETIPYLQALKISASLSQLLHQVYDKVVGHHKLQSSASMELLYA